MVTLLPSWARDKSKGEPWKACPLAQQLDRLTVCSRTEFTTMNRPLLLTSGVSP